MCNPISTEHYNSNGLQFALDISSQGSKEIYYNCSEISPDSSVSVPYSRFDTNEPFESGYVPNIGLKSANYYLFNATRDLDAYSYIAALTPESTSTKEPLIAINSDFTSTDVEISASILLFCFVGQRFV